MIIIIIANIYWMLSTFNIHFGIIASELAFTTELWTPTCRCSTHTLGSSAFKFFINDSWSNLVGKSWNTDWNTSTIKLILWNKEPILIALLKYV